MNRSRIRALARAASAACAAACLVAAGTAAARGDDLVTLRFKPAPDQVINYDGVSRRQMFFPGTEVTFNTGQHVEVSFGEALGDSAFQLELKYVRCTGSMLRGGNLQEWSDPVQAQGRTLRVSVDERGEVLDVLGVLPGLPRGRATRQYVEKWFFELPQQPVGKGSEWTIEIDERSAEDDADKYSITGSTEFELKKFGKKRGVAVAEIEGKSVIDIVTTGAQGVFEGRAESKIKIAVAVEGGYIVEMNRSVDIKGKLIDEDPITGRTEERNVTRVESDEVKLAR